MDSLDGRIIKRIAFFAARRDVKHLVKFLQYREETTVRASAAALAQIGEDAVEPVIRSLPKTGAAGETTLAMIGKPAVIPVVEHLWAGETRITNTLGVLAISGAEGASAAVCELSFLHPSEDVRFGLVAVHGRLLSGRFGVTSRQVVYEDDHRATLAS